MESLLPNFLFHFNLVEVIGEGGNSTVWKTEKLNGGFFTVKIPYVGVDDDMIINEAKLMSVLSKLPNNSPFLTFYGLYSYGDHPVIVSELFSGDELHELIQKIRQNKIQLSEHKILWIIKSIFEQISYLNKAGMNHGDINASNVLYNKKRVVLIDISNHRDVEGRSINIKAEESRTTIKFYAKAIIQGWSPQNILDQKDIFETGELLMKLLGFHSYRTWEEFEANPYKFRVDSQYEKLNIIVNSCMEIDITKRPSADDVIKFINDI